MATYGKLWRGVIEAGIMSVMAGHISLPAWQGHFDHPEDALPATLCSKLQIDLLRNELGFDGVLVSDAAPMIGLTSRVAEDQAVVEFIKAGGDSYLFARPEKDFKALLQAVQSGYLSEDRVYESAKRMLDMKLKLGLGKSPFSPAPSAAQKASFTASARQIAEDSLTVAKDNGRIGDPPAKGSQILTVTINFEGNKFAPAELDAFDAALIEAGYDITHLRNPGAAKLVECAGKYATVFLNFHIVPHMLIGHTRLYGDQAFNFWHGFYVSHPDVRCTSFGTPYLLFDQPHLPNMLLAYGGVEPSHRAAVEVWLGQRKAVGKCPVQMPRVVIRDRVPNFAGV